MYGNNRITAACGDKIAAATEVFRASSVMLSDQLYEYHVMHM